MDAPLVGGLELEYNSFVDEARESLFEDPSSGERLDGGPLSLDHDLRGGIGEGLGGHVAVMRGELGVEVERAGGVVEGGCVVLRGAEVPFRVVGRLQVTDTVNDPRNKSQLGWSNILVKSRTSRSDLCFRGDVNELSGLKSP